MSSLQIIRGRSGTGKSTVMIDVIKNIPKDERAIIIVPEQFSFEAEKRLVTALGSSGINGRDVLTFNRLIHRMIKTNKEYLRPSGKQMILYKSVEKLKKENNIFEKSLSKNGFLDMLSSMISEMKRYNIDQNILAEKAETMTDGMLKRKIDAISKIYSEYDKLIPDNLLDSENNMALLAEFISESDEFSDTHIFIDEFSDFLPQAYDVISVLMTKAKSMTVSLCLDDFIDEGSIFSPSIKTLDTLRSIAADIGVTVIDDIFTSEYSRNNRFESKELEFLEKEWENDSVYTLPTPNISAFTAVDPYSEIEHTAIEILRLVRENNYRFRDISVLCADMDNYYHLIEVIFADYDIPYFTDKKIPITDHPVIIPVLAIFDIFANSFSYDSIFSYLRTGYANISDDETDILENYVLEHGISGKKSWFSENNWEEITSRIFDAAINENSPAPADTYEENNLIDDIRRRVIKPFMQFDDNFNGKKTVREICTALYEFLNSGIDFIGTLKKKINYFCKNGNMDEAEQYTQIWKILIEVLDQAVTVMGDDFCGMERFSEILYTGLSTYSISIIPSSVDMVSIGSADRSRTSQMKALFITGAVYGKLPELGIKEGLLSDKDRHILSNIGITLAPDTKTKIFDSRFKIYKAVTKATNKLFISRSCADTSGKTQNPAQIFTDLLHMFPNMNYSESPLSGTVVQPEFAAAAKPAFSHMITALSADNDIYDVWHDAYAWYKHNDNFNHRLNILERVKNEYNENLSLENVKKLYGLSTEYSASRLEVFAHCPFRYFVKYGLHANERVSWKVQSFDIGTLMHSLLKNFCERVEELKTGSSAADIKAVWRNLTSEDIHNIISELLHDTERKILSRSIPDKGRIEFLLSQIGNTLYESAEIIVNSITAGEFAPIAYEKSFSHFEITGVSGVKTFLRGQIDRIDLIENNNNVYIRIIDYKSGTKKFDITDILNSFGMQLSIYAAAAVALYNSGKLLHRNSEKDIKIAGILYSSLRDDISAETPPVDENNYTASFKYNGLLLNDGLSLHFNDKNYAVPDSDTGTSKENSSFVSEFFPFKCTKDGNLYASSSVASDEDFENLSKIVNNNIDNINSKIYNGDISIYPYFVSDTSNSCNHCPYGEICRFDIKHNKRRYKKTLDRDKWSHIRKLIEKEEK